MADEIAEIDVQAGMSVGSEVTVLAPAFGTPPYVFADITPDTLEGLPFALAVDGTITLVATIGHVGVTTWTMNVEITDDDDVVETWDVVFTAIGPQAERDRFTAVDQVTEWVRPAGDHVFVVLRTPLGGFTGVIALQMKTIEDDDDAASVVAQWDESDVAAAMLHAVIAIPRTPAMRAGFQYRLKALDVSAGSIAYIIDA